jgi:hypothetical protein
MVRIISAAPADESPNERICGMKWWLAAEVGDNTDLRLGDSYPMVRIP